MAKSGNAYDKNLQTEGLIRGGYRFLLANLLYYSGHLRTLEARQRSAGASPFRILRYERITNPLNCPYPPLPDAFVTPEAFYSQMRYLAKNTNVIPLPELLSYVESDKEMAPHTVAITFDGGSRDIHDVAAPVLREFGLSATVFVATAFVDTMNLFWRDKFLAAMLFLEQCGIPFPDIPALETALPDVFDKKRSLGRSMARNIYIIRYLEKASSQERAAALTYLGAALETVGGLPLERQFLSWEELRRLQSQGFSVGFHTHSYRTLEDIREQETEPTQALEQELTTSREIFHSQRIQTLPVFSFPDGITTKEGRGTLTNQGFKFGLGIGSYQLSKANSNNLPIISRTPITQATSFRTPIFACRLWDISYGGQRF